MNFKQRITNLEKKLTYQRVALLLLVPAFAFYSVII